MKPLRFGLLIACVAAVVTLLPAADGDAKAGKAVFDQQCTVCHYADKEEVKVGPGLKGVFHREQLNNGKKPSDETITAIINEGGATMPPYGEILSSEEKVNVVAYLKTL